MSGISEKKRARLNGLVEKYTSTVNPALKERKVIDLINWTVPAVISGIEKIDLSPREVSYIQEITKERFPEFVERAERASQATPFSRRSSRPTRPAISSPQFSPAAKAAAVPAVLSPKVRTKLAPPLAETPKRRAESPEPTSKRKKAESSAIYFDNDSSSLEQVLKFCPKIRAVKTAERSPQFPNFQLLAQANENNAFLRAAYQELANGFDPSTGFGAEQVPVLNKWLEQSKDQSVKRYAIFDWSGTLTKFPTTFPYGDLPHPVSNEDRLEILFGGAQRLAAIRKVFADLKENGVVPVIITNAQECGMPNFFELTNFANVNVEVICAKAHPDKAAALRSLKSDLCETTSEKTPLLEATQSQPDVAALLDQVSALPTKTLPPIQAGKINPAELPLAEMPAQIPAVGSVDKWRLMSRKMTYIGPYGKDNANDLQRILRTFQRHKLFQSLNVPVLPITLLDLGDVFFIRSPVLAGTPASQWVSNDQSRDGVLYKVWNHKSQGIADMQELLKEPVMVRKYCKSIVKYLLVAAIMEPPVGNLDLSNFRVVLDGKSTPRFYPLFYDSVRDMKTFKQSGSLWKLLFGSVPRSKMVIKEFASCVKQNCAELLDLLESTLDNPSLNRDRAALLQNKMKAFCAGIPEGKQQFNEIIFFGNDDTPMRLLRPITKEIKFVPISETKNLEETPFEQGELAELIASLPNNEYVELITKNAGWTSDVYDAASGLIENNIFQLYEWLNESSGKRAVAFDWNQTLTQFGGTPSLKDTLAVFGRPDDKQQFFEAMLQYLMGGNERLAMLRELFSTLREDYPDVEVIVASGQSQCGTQRFSELITQLVGYPVRVVCSE